jgi:hypothetical protein
LKRCDVAWPDENMVDKALTQLAQFGVKSASRFVAAVLLDQGLEWLW